MSTCVLCTQFISLSLVASNKDLETRVSSFTSSQSSSVSDIDHLRNRVDETDREKRDLIGVVSRLKEDATQRDGALNVVEIRALD